MVDLDFQDCVILSLVCLFSTFFLFAFFFYKKPKNNFDLPPSPPSLPILGYLQILYDALSRKSFHKSFQKISSKYGPFLHLGYSNINFVLVSSASVVYDIFKVQDTNVSFRGPVAIEECLLFGSYGFFRIPYGDYWKFTKKLIMSKVLGPQALERSRGFREVELDRFYRIILDKATNKESVKIGEEALRFVINTLGKVSMGSSFSDGNNEAAKVAELTMEFSALPYNFFMAQMFNKILEKLKITLLKKDIMDVSNRFDELLERVLANHEKKLDEHQESDECMDFMLNAYRDALLEDENAKYKISRYHIKAVLVELFFGAGDSSSTTIQWAMAEILNNPKILERLREEINSVVGKTRLVRETDILKLPYLQAIINETLRMHPVGPLLPREFEKGCDVGGFYIQKGTILIINAYDVMRDAYYWEEPNEFKPERFLVTSRLGQEEERREQALKFLPFGAGRRGCPGSNLGYVMVGTAIGVMVQYFDWEIKGGGDKVNMEEACGLRFFLGLAHPLECIPIPLTINPLPTNMHIP
ncbi:unnamed protein product [Cochlearia groenlandica]